MSGLDFRKTQLSKMGQNANCGRRVPVHELMRCVRMADGLNMTERSELALPWVFQSAPIRSAGS
jgi:hypothetical protein